MAPRETAPAPLRELLDADGQLRCLPHRHDTDGFFAVRLTRSAEGDVTDPPERP